MQAKLLKVLEEKKLRRLGGLREHRLAFRVIAATNQDLELRVHQGRFRSDLYYRLKMVQLAVPPLRERDGDVLLLARAFLAMHASRYRKPQLFFTPCAEQALCRWHWPGNVRELRNMLEQIALMSRQDAIAAHDLPLPPACAHGAPASAHSTPAEQTLNLEGMERQYLVAALGQSRWNVTQAAKTLGLSRDAMRYRIGKYSLKNRS
jgi:DNA-binding NtrC family response regulator